MTEKQLRQKLEDWFVDTKQTTVVTRRVFRIIDAMGIDKFKSSSEAQWLAAYRDARPTSEVDLAKRSLVALHAAQNQIRAFEAEERKETAEADRIRKLAEETEANRKAAEARLKADMNPVFERKFLRGVADLMEYCGFDTVDLKKVAEFRKAFNFNPPELTGKEA